MITLFILGFLFAVVGAWLSLGNDIIRIRRFVFLVALGAGFLVSSLSTILFNMSYKENIETLQIQSKLIKSTMITNNVLIKKGNEKFISNYINIYNGCCNFEKLTGFNKIIFQDSVESLDIIDLRDKI